MEARSIRRARPGHRSAALLAAALAACSKGGSTNGSNSAPRPSMSVSTHAIQVSAALGAAAPVGSVVVTVTNIPSDGLYLGGQYTHVGIESVQVGSTTADSATVLVTFKLPEEVGPGRHDDTLRLAVCTDAACASQADNSPQTVTVSYTVSGTFPGLTSLSPSSAFAGGEGFTLTALGTAFTPSSVLQWNGSPRSTTFVTMTELQAAITAGDIATAGTAQVSVAYDAAGHGVSLALPFVVQPLPLALTSVFPSRLAAGGPDFPLTAVGTGFGAASALTWNGTPLPTTLLSPRTLRATVPAASIAAAGTAAVAVQDGTGTTGALQVVIAPPAAEAVAFQITPEHSGAIDLGPVTFPASSLWSVDLGTLTSYPIIAAGKVFTTAVAADGARLVALDQATGAAAWEPVSIPGARTAAYDGGTLFVLASASFGESTLQAFDAATGARKWSRALTGQSWFNAAPTARGGMVFVGGSGSGGTLYAVDAGSGTLAWTQGVLNGDHSSPAVTAGGVYVAYPCQAYDFDPATGTSLWHSSTGCEGGGGATPVVAGGVLYAPDGFGTYSGTTFDPATGAVLGSYTADNPPAFGPLLGYFLQSGRLRGISPADGTVRWTFDGDGQLVTSPIAVSEYALVGSASGMLYALDGATGAQVWSADLGAALPPGAGWNSGAPLLGLAAGEGLLVVPAGTRLTAFSLRP